MPGNEQSGERDRPKGGFLTSRAGLAFLGFLVVAGALLFTEHRAHVLGALVWLASIAREAAVFDLIGRRTG
jgi:hypothetical protein